MPNFPQKRRTSIRPKKLRQLAREFVNHHHSPKRNPKGGRPKTYPDNLILTIASVQRLGHLSFREALEYCGDFFPDMPSLSAYHERLEAFPEDIRKKFIAHLGA